MSQLTEQKEPTVDKEKMKDVLAELISLAKSIPVALLATKEGVGVASILLGTGLKEVGLKTGIDLWPFDKEGGGPLSKITDAISGRGLTTPFGEGPFGSDVSLLKIWAETPQGQAILDTLFPNRHKEDAEPINETDLALAAETAGKANFGFIPVADALIFGGFIALTAEGLKGLGELVPLGGGL